MKPISKRKSVLVKNQSPETPKNFNSNALFQDFSEYTFKLIVVHKYINLTLLMELNLT